MIEGEVCPDHIHMPVSISPKNERFGVYGIPKVEEYITHISKKGKYEICIPKPRVLV